MGSADTFLRQVLAVVAYSTPAALLITLLVWWGLWARHTGTPTVISAARAFFATLGAIFLVAVIRFDTPAHFAEAGMGSIVFVSFVGAVMMMVLFPGRRKT